MSSIEKNTTYLISKNLQKKIAVKASLQKRNKKAANKLSNSEKAYRSLVKIENLETRVKPFIIQFKREIIFCDDYLSNTQKKDVFKNISIMFYLLRTEGIVNFSSNNESAPFNDRLLALGKEIHEYKTRINYVSDSIEFANRNYDEAIVFHNRLIELIRNGKYIAQPQSVIN